MKSLRLDLVHLDFTDGHRWLAVGHFPRYFVDKGHQLVSLGAVFHFRSMKPWLVRFPVSAAA